MSPIMKVTLEKEKSSVICEMTSVEECSMFLKVEQMKILGQNCKINRVGENPFGQTINLQKLITNAEKQAQAQAAAFMAIKKLTDKDYREELQLTRGNILTTQSSILKISNLVDRNEKIGIQEILADILEKVVTQFEKFGRINSLFVVNKQTQKIGAEFGSVFVEFNKLKNATNAYRETLKQKYNDRQIKVVYIQPQVYDDFFRNLNDNRYQPLSEQESFENESQRSSLYGSEDEENSENSSIDNNTGSLKENLQKPPPLPQQANEPPPIPVLPKTEQEELDGPPPIPLVLDQTVVDGPPPIPIQSITIQINTENAKIQNSEKIEVTIEEEEI